VTRRREASFVTGGSGLVGGALIRALVADGRAVRALARSESSADRVAALGADPVRGDLFDAAALARGMAEAAVVFHAAGVNALCTRDPRPMYRANVDGADRVVIAAGRAGVHRVVHTSSAATIGEPAGVVASESTPHRGSFLSHYERSKTLGERRVLARARALGLDLVCVNPASVQGPGRAGGTAQLLLRAVDGRLPVVVDTWISLVDIDDCVRGHLLAAERGRRGERYLLSGASLTTADALGLIAAVVPPRRRVRVLPRTAARALGALGELARVSGIRTPVCAESVRVVRHGHRYDGTRSRTELGLAYTPVRRTFERTLAWFADEGLIPPIADARPRERPDN
jgi:dihydroflavonol-4-reductase